MTTATITHTLTIEIEDGSTHTIQITDHQMHRALEVEDAWTPDATEEEKRDAAAVELAAHHMPELDGQAFTAYLN